LLRKSIVNDGQQATTAADLKLYTSHVPLQNFSTIRFNSDSYGRVCFPASHAVPASEGTSSLKIALGIEVPGT
jgi:hypothetical protein